MADSEYQDPTIINKLPDEPSVLNTKIEIANPGVVLSLQVKLQEYRGRNAPFEQLSWAEQIERYGPDRFTPIFKEVILETVLTLAGDTERDFSTQPMLLPEIALATAEETGINLTESIVTPFVYDSDAMVYQPDWRLLRERGGAQEDYDFLNAYMVIKTYASGEQWGVEGGTGLPVLPYAPTKS